MRNGNGRQCLPPRSHHPKWDAVHDLLSCRAYLTLVGDTREAGACVRAASGAFLTAIPGAG